MAIKEAMTTTTYKLIKRFTFLNGATISVYYVYVNYEQNAFYTVITNYFLDDCIPKDFLRDSLGVRRFIQPFTKEGYNQIQWNALNTAITYLNKTGLNYNLFK